MAWYQFSKTPAPSIEVEFENPELLTKSNGVHVYLQPVSGIARYKYRGKANKPGDDPISFARMMAKSGLKVLFTSEFKGTFVNSNAEEVE